MVSVDPIQLLKLPRFVVMVGTSSQIVIHRHPSYQLHSELRMVVEIIELVSSLVIVKADQPMVVSVFDDLSQCQV